MKSGNAFPLQRLFSVLDKNASNPTNKKRNSITMSRAVSLNNNNYYNNGNENVAHLNFNEMHI